MTPPEDASRCQASTARGVRCKNPAVFGQPYCTVHQRREQPAERRCLGRTQTGERCKIPPVKDSDYCGFHRPGPGIPPGELKDVVGDLDRMIDGLRGRISTAGNGTPAPARPAPDVASEPTRFEPDPASPYSDGARSMSPLRALKMLSGLKDRLPGISSVALPDSVKGLAFMARATAEGLLELAQRRARGEYETDPYGLDEEVLAVVRPLLTFLYKYYWRVEINGIEHVPMDGPALLVSNHSGVLPWDGAMIGTAIHEELPVPRIARALYLSWFARLPFISELLSRCGGVQALNPNGEQLLRDGELVVVFPEGLKGVGKHFRDRYKLQRFGRSGFVRMAIRAQVPIIPVSVVGAEEIHPVLARLDVLGKPFGFPFFPVTPTWPLLGPIGMIPLPSKWIIHFHEPIDMAAYAPESERDYTLVQRINDQVKETIQAKLIADVKTRGGAFL